MKVEMEVAMLTINNNDGCDDGYNIVISINNNVITKREVSGREIELAHHKSITT
ncbi:9608_t:CDS:2, partial [Entrophospora sp. SA101]